VSVAGKHPAELVENGVPVIEGRGVNGIEPTIDQSDQHFGRKFEVGCPRRATVRGRHGGVGGDRGPCVPSFPGPRPTLAVVAVSRRPVGDPVLPER